MDGIAEDQRLADGLQSIVATLTAPGALDGFAPLQTRRLEEATVTSPRARPGGIGPNACGLEVVQELLRRLQRPIPLRDETYQRVDDLVRELVGELAETGMPGRSRAPLDRPTAWPGSPSCCG